MHGDRPDFERGDKIGCVCRNCGDRYTHIEKVEQDPPRSTSRCPDCYATQQKIRGAMVAGTVRIRDDDVREDIIDAIESETPYEVFVEERVADCWIYDPEDL